MNRTTTDNSQRRLNMFHTAKCTQRIINEHSYSQSCRAYQIAHMRACVLAQMCCENVLMYVCLHAWVCVWMAVRLCASSQDVVAQSQLLSGA